MSALLEVEDLRVQFRVRGGLSALLAGERAFIDAVCGVSFAVGAGETVALIGESGSGKTTLARTLNGLVTPCGGSIRYRGSELRGLSEGAWRPHRREITMMFQDPVGSLSPRMTVRALLAEPFHIHGVAVPDLEAEVQRLLEMVNLPLFFADRYPHQLSGGQARRVGVARALALTPRLIVADEPTAGLDVSVQGEVLNLLARLQKELGISILIITHNLNVVRHTSDRLAIMYLGRIVEQGRTDEIFAHPRHPYTHALLAANPEPDPDAVIERVELKGEVPSVFSRPSGCEFHTRCPYAQALCRREPAVATAVAEGHVVWCHFPRPGARPVGPTRDVASAG